MITKQQTKIKAKQQNENNSCATPWLLALGRKTIANKIFIKNFTSGASVISLIVNTKYIQIHTIIMQMHTKYMTNKLEIIAKTTN